MHNKHYVTATLSDNLPRNRTLYSAVNVNLIVVHKLPTRLSSLRLIMIKAFKVSFIEVLPVYMLSLYGIYHFSKAIPVAKLLALGLGGMVI